MKKSFSYHLLHLVLKLKGVKKEFRKDPIDFKKLRREDIYQPKANFFKHRQIRNFKILENAITEIKASTTSKRLILFVHGGAFISGPAKHHWDSLRTISKNTTLNIWLCDYPKAPENKISVLSQHIDAVYETALKTYEAEDIILLGDSAGGTLVASLVQRLIQKNIAVPFKIILISPVMDASMTNPQIEKLNQVDPMLAKKGVLSAKKMCAENSNLKDVQLSPLYGNFEGFPTTVLFLATHDICYPDQLLAVKKLNNAAVDLVLYEGDEMPHIWPLLPFMKEAKIALDTLIKSLNE